jgi:hypothetical protein
MIENPQNIVKIEGCDEMGQMIKNLGKKCGHVCMFSE